jgi:hypothetical protein
MQKEVQKWAALKQGIDGGVNLAFRSLHRRRLLSQISVPSDGYRVCHNYIILVTKSERQPNRSRLGVSPFDT